MISFALKHMMLVIVLCAIGAVSLSTGTWFWTRVLFTLALAINLAAILASTFLRGWPRAFWAGFALFGWSYWFIANHPLLQIAEHQLFVNEIVVLLKDYTPEANKGLNILHKTHSISIFSYERAIYTVFGLVFSLIGGIVSCWVYSSSGTLANTTAE